MNSVNSHEENKSGESEDTIAFDRVEVLQNTLDVIISFINNCDTKASIILALIGVIITVIFSGNMPDNFLQMHEKARELSSCGSVIYMWLCKIAVIAVAIGAILLVAVLFARVTRSGGNSKIYFGDIAENIQYATDAKKITADTYTDDIAGQIYINAKICKKKYQFYNTGLIVEIIGGISFFVLYMVGVRVFM